MDIEDKYINREISWLQFNGRVLQEAADDTVPLVERLRFLGIFSNNLDEFFRVRYATVRRIAQSGDSGFKALGGFDAGKLMKQITNITIKLQDKSLDILSAIQEDLKDHDIFIVNEKEVTPEQGKFLKDYFFQKVSPALVTLVLNDLEDPPRLKDGSAYLAVKMILKKEGAAKKTPNRYILIEIPRIIDRFIELPGKDGKKYIILLDDLIRYNLKSFFSIFEYESLSAHMIKITRDAELDLESDMDKSYIDKLKSSVKERTEGEPVRFVYDDSIEEDTLRFLLSTLQIEATDSLIPGGRYHNRRNYMNFPHLGDKALLYPAMEPLPVKGMTIEGSIIQRIDQRDYLQYVPYHTFSYTVRFLRETAIDPQVKSIKITIYRLAEFSHIASSLINAVKNGKKVTAAIELRARFDESNNIQYAEKLQREGINVIFGVRGLKVHNKTCVIERIENGQNKRYGFISTGNFNEKTAKQYTDYTLFTANQEILEDIDKIFDFYQTNYKVNRYKHLIVSPHYSRNRFEEMIDREIAYAKQGKSAGIRLKFNSLSDYGMIDKLYEASQAGVKIKLIVRGICSLRPGIPGLSENIEAISIVDRYLEHPRLLIFENGGQREVFISSADWMTRNLDYRVEVTCPIYQKDIREELVDTFEICWQDNVKARDFSAKEKNAYRQNDKPKLRSQFATYDYYLRKLGRTETLKTANHEN